MYLGLGESAKDSEFAWKIAEKKQLVVSCPAFLGRIEIDGLIAVVDKTVLEDAAWGTIAEQ